MSADQFSADKFEGFCDYIIEKNLMSPETARARKVSALKILAVLDAAERQDLRALDRDLAFHRFQNRSGSTYTPSSLGVYRSRFNSALDDFLRYVGNPSGFRPNSMKSQVTTKSDGPGPKKALKKNPPNPNTLELPDGAPLPLPPPTDSLMLPIPIRQGVVVKIFGIPHDLTAEEAKKIATIVTGYALGS